MTDEDRPRRFTDEEMAELNRLVDSAPMTPAPDGPLPPLESDIPEWRAGRWRTWAAGGRFDVGRHGEPVPTRVQATELRKWAAASAVVDLFCGPISAGALLLRVAVVDGRLLARWNVVRTKRGDGAYTEFLLTELPPATAVECRRRGHDWHPISRLALEREARKARPGRPRRVNVLDVTTT